MENAMKRTLKHEDYGVAMICPLEVEMSAVRYMLDEEHVRLQSKEGDSNRYIYGRLSGHNVVIGYLPHGSQGIGAAATVATHMKRSFPDATLRLLIGIGGGVPSAENDIRLGDVVVSMPTGVGTGVVQYDLIKETISGFKRKGSLERIPQVWCDAVVDLNSDHRYKDNLIPEFLAEMITRNPRLKDYRRPSAESDTLFLPDNLHVVGEQTCLKCDQTRVVQRSRRPTDHSKIFYGLMASGNRVIKNAEVRDRISQDAGGALCFEMEAAGLMNDFRCIVIRGISDYADSHKNDDWHAYGAAAAAGCAKELLLHVDSNMASKSSRGASQNEHWTVDRSMNSYFTGRNEIVTEIVDAVQIALKDAVGTNQSRVVITGMGGQGKSEICLQVAHHLRSSFWGVFWVDVDTLESAEVGFQSIGSRLNLTGPSMQDIRQILANSRDRWLLFLDNADDVETDYQQYFPSGQSGLIILTSRNSECHKYATIKQLSLDGLGPDQARELLLKSAQMSVSQHGANKQDADKIATSLLGGHPLALIQAGTYVARGHCSLAEYPGVFQRQRKRVLRFPLLQAQPRYGNVYATFEASADRLQASQDEVSSDALQLLSLFAMLASSQLPLSLFRFIWLGAHQILRKDADVDKEEFALVLDTQHVSHVLPLVQVENETWDSFRLIQAVNRLEAYSLVAVNGSADTMNVTMHPLTHAWAKDRQEKTQQLQSWLKAACMVSMSVHAEGGYSFWMEPHQQLLPHIVTLVSVEPDMMFDGDLVHPMIAAILTRCGWILNHYDYNDHLATLLESLFTRLEINENTVDESWTDLYRLLGSNLRQRGSTKQATTLVEQLMRILEQTLPETSPQLLNIQSELALTYINMQSLEDKTVIRKAVRLMENVVRIQEQILVKDHPDLLTSRHMLALAYLAENRSEEVVELLEPLVRTRQQVLVENHPSLLFSQHTLARAYLEGDHLKEAVELLEQVVRTRQQVLVENHPDLLYSQDDLACAYRKENRLEEALELFEQVVRTRQQVLVENHPELLSSQHDLAHAYLEEHRLEEAVELFEQVIRIRQQVLVENHSDLLSSQHTLARAYLEGNRSKEAVELLEQVVRTQQQVLVENHPDLLSSQHELARAYLEGNRLEEAVNLIEQVVRTGQQTLAETDSDLLVSQHVLSVTLHRLGLNDRARLIMRHVVKMEKVSLGEEHPDRKDNEAWLRIIEAEMEDKMVKGMASSSEG